MYHSTIKLFSYIILPYLQLYGTNKILLAYQKLKISLYKKVDKRKYDRHKYLL